MIRCPNCDTLIDDDRFDLDEDLSEEDRARYTGYAAGRDGETRDAPDKYEAPQRNITGRFDVVLALNHHWLIGFDAGASVRATVRASVEATT